MEEKDNKLPGDFEPIQPDDMSKEDCLFEVYKSENYEKIVPNLIKAIDTKNEENKKLITE